MNSQPIPEIIASRYRVHRELGRGGMGAVYLVEHIHTGDHLALKVLLSQRGISPETVERFKREARAPAHIRSENVVKVTDADVAEELGGAPFLVMELLNGADLEKLVREHGALPPATVVSYLAQAARALDKAHAIGIVHRDLKPENIFLHQREDGSTVVKILDFGISKMMKGGANDIAGASLTSTGAVMGTPLYMTPEQGRGEISAIGPASDIWAVGLIAYRLLTGTVYWRADTIAQLMVQIMVEPMAPPSTLTPGLPPAFDAWFARSCHRQTAGRWGSVGEQIDALARAFGIALPNAGGPVTSMPLVMPAVISGAVPAVSGATANAMARSMGSELTVTSQDRKKQRNIAAAVVGGLVTVGVLVAGTVAVVRLTTSAPPTGLSANAEVSGSQEGATASEFPPPSAPAAPLGDVVPSAAASSSAVMPPPPPARTSPTPAATRPPPSEATAREKTPPEEKTPPTSPPKPGTTTTSGYNPAAP